MATKWVCSVCGAIYDPAKINPPGEMTGAARCKVVTDAEDSTLPDDATCHTCGAGCSALKKMQE